MTDPYNTWQMGNSEATLYEGDDSMFYGTYAQTSPTAYRDLNSPVDPYGTDQLGTSSYLPPNPHPMYDPGMAHALPDLGSVEEVLKGGISSIERLSLGYNKPMNGTDPSLSPHQHAGVDHQLQWNGTNGSGSMSGGSSGSATNGLMPNGVTVHNNMQMDIGEAPHHIKIIEEPMEFGYRFRYEVEGKAHGGLQGQSSKAASGTSKRGHKIYPEIQVCNVPTTIDEVRIEARLVSATESYLPHPNKCSGKDCNERGIFRKTIKRNEHPEFKLVLNNLTILQVKKGDQKNSLLDQLRDIAMNGFTDRHADQDLDKEAEKLSKVRHNGVVRIRFQAAFYDMSTGRWQVAYTHSKPVHDQKQTNAAELRICRVSSQSAPVTGSNSEIYLLCEKVTKDDIKVKFKHDQWEADGKFQGTDVHYQFAIVFRAPAYKNLDIQKDVKVEMMLFRPSTGTYSKPIEFTYHPTQTEEEGVLRKRKKPMGPSDMGGYPPSYMSPFGGGGGGSPYNPSSRDSPSGGYYNYQGGGYNYSKDAPIAAHSQGKGLPDVATGEKGLDMSKQKNLPSTVEEVEADHAPAVKLEAVEPIPVATADKVKSEPVSNKPEPKANDDDDLEIDGCPLPPHKSFVVKDIGHFDKTRTLAEGPEAFQLMTAKRTEPKPTTAKHSTSARLDSPTRFPQSLERERSQRKYMENHMTMCRDLVVESLMNFAITGDHLYFISQFRYFLSVKDEYGDNSLHMAVINGQPRALNDMLGICKATRTESAINQLNDKHQTPLHVATIIRNVQMVDMLLRFDADPTIADLNGSDCFHVAARNKDSKTLHLLCQWLKFRSKDMSALDRFNYEGETPLHRAVQGDSVDCVHELVQAGADVNRGDGTSGRTPLHHAVQQCSVVTTAELLLHAKADVNCQAFDGSSPLHMAVSLKDEDISRMLIKSGADPLMKNRHYCPEEDEEPVGLDAYDLCEGNKQMLEVIEQSLVKDKKSQEVIGSIQNLPVKVKDRLSQLLDKESHDWKRIAKLFELTSVISYLEKSANPTSLLLNYLASDDKTIKDLISGLSKIARQDCIEVIEQWGMSPARSTKHPDIKDSGFMESFTSGMKSETLQSGVLK